MREVRIFHRADAHRARHGLLLGFGHVGRGLSHQFQRTLFGFVQQQVQLDGSAFAGGEQTLRQSHQPEPDMPQRRGHARLAGDGKKLPEVQLLAFIRHIQNGGGLEFLLAGEHGGEVRRGVVVAAVGFAHDARRQFFVVQKCHQRAFALAHETKVLQLLHHTGEGIVVIGFAADQLKRHAQPRVNPVEFLQRQINEGLPQRAVFRVARL